MTTSAVRKKRRRVGTCVCMPACLMRGVRLLHEACLAPCDRPAIARSRVAVHCKVAPCPPEAHLHQHDPPKHGSSLFSRRPVLIARHQHIPGCRACFALAAAASGGTPEAADSAPARAPAWKLLCTAAPRPGCASSTVLRCDCACTQGLRPRVVRGRCGSSCVWEMGPQGRTRSLPLPRPRCAPPRPVECIDNGYRGGPSRCRASVRRS